MNPKVSIIVPVYNAARYLSYCVESILGQSYRNLQVILVADAYVGRVSSRLVCLKRGVGFRPCAVCEIPFVRADRK